MVQTSSSHSESSSSVSLTITSALLPHNDSNSSGNHIISIYNNIDTPRYHKRFFWLLKLRKNFATFVKSYVFAKITFANFPLTSYLTYKTLAKKGQNREKVVLIPENCLVLK